MTEVEANGRTWGYRLRGVSIRRKTLGLRRSKLFRSQVSVHLCNNVVELLGNVLLSLLTKPSLDELVTFNALDSRVYADLHCTNSTYPDLAPAR